MTSGPHQRVPFRRRREGRTDYRRRLNLLRSGIARAVVRKTNMSMVVQVVEYTEGGDRVVASAVGRDLKKLGWTASTGNVPAAYLTGLLAGRRAVAKGVTAGILDMGRHIPTKGGRVFAVLKGLVDAGVSIPHDASILPPENRITGAHISADVKAMFEATKAKVEGP
ncbi:MAG TPA: 50S ribosomal protein L18 [Thermoplasmata archaeon]|nr:50S ribosomal protein L18 [Thermoplasmata archaeon]